MLADIGSRMYWAYSCFIVFTIVYEEHDIAKRSILDDGAGPGRLSLKPEIIPPAPELQCDDPVSVSSSHVLTGDQTSVLGNSSLLPIQRWV